MNRPLTTIAQAILEFSALMVLAISPVHAAAAEQPATAEKGRQLYGSFCARCHGLNMVNNGGATFDLRTFPKDQHERFERSVTKGLRAMPAWGSTLKPEDVQALWLYVSSGGAS